MRDLGTLGGDWSVATGINSSGQVVGMSGVAGGGGPNNSPGHAFITGPNGTGMRDIGTLGGAESSAAGINAAGQVAGMSDTPSGARHAFITDPGGVGMRDLGPVGSFFSTASGINESGQVIGRESKAQDLPDASSHFYLSAFITGPDGVGMRDLGIVGSCTHYIFDCDSQAFGINSAGQVVGLSNSTTEGRRAFVTGPNGTDMMDLNSFVNLPFRRLVQAVAINNHGQVVAIVPEPETYALLLSGLALIAFAACRKKTGK